MLVACGYSSSMELPNVLHPTTFNIGGYAIRVMAYFALTDRQAARIAMHAYRSRKWTKADLKKIHIQHWLGDKDSPAPR